MQTNLAVLAALVVVSSAWAQDDGGVERDSQPVERPGAGEPGGDSSGGPGGAAPRASLTGERAGKFEGFYMRGGVGLVGFADSDLVGGGETRETEFDPGYGGSAALGYDFGSLFQPGASRDRLTINLRSEVEFSFERADADDEGGPGPARLEEVSTWGLALNAYVDFDTPTRWTFYAGLGVGAARVETDGVGYSDRDTAGLVQLLGGAIFDVTSSASLYAGLRSRGYSEFDSGTAELEDLASGSLEVGLIFSF